MSSALTDNPKVQQLAKLMDLQVPPSYRGRITEWEFVPDVGIVIKKVEMYSTDGEFIKEADLEQLQKSAHQYSFVFKKL